MLKFVIMVLTVFSMPVHAQDVDVSVQGEFGRLAGSLRVAQAEAPLVLIVPGSGPIDHILYDQLTLHTKSKRVLKKIDLALADLKAGQEIDQKKLPLVLRHLFSPVNQKFFMDWMSYDSAEILAGYQGQLLILQGTTDFQVSVKDARKLSSVRPDAKLIILDGINHSMSKTDLIFPPSDIALDGAMMDIMSEFIRTSD